MVYIMAALRYSDAGLRCHGSPIADSYVTGYCCGTVDLLSRDVGQPGPESDFSLR